MAIKKASKGKTVKLSPPQYSYAACLRAFFAGDPRIKVGECDGETVKVTVSDKDCYDALCQCLETEKQFGLLTLNVEIVPANRNLAAKKPGKCWTTRGAIEEVLSKNPLFVEMMEQYIPVLRKYTVHCVMAPTVVQFANDNIGSPWKLTTCTAEEVARAIFVFAGIQYCTAPFVACGK